MKYISEDLEEKQEWKTGFAWFQPSVCSTTFIFILNQRAMFLSMCNRQDTQAHTRIRGKLNGWC